MYHRDEIIVLGRQGFSRTSLKLAVWGRKSGLVGLTARGVMRSSNNRIGDIPCLFDRALAVFYAVGDGSRGILADYALVESFDVPERLLPLGAAAAAVRALWEGFPSEPADAPAVFSVLNGMLAAAREEGVDDFWLGVSGVLEVLRAAGLRPEFAVCAGCGAEMDGPGVFSFRVEGVLCGRCSGMAGDETGVVVLDAGVLKALSSLGKRGFGGLKGLGGLSRRRARAVIRLLKRWFYVTIGRELRAIESLVSPVEGRKAM